MFRKSVFLLLTGASLVLIPIPANAQKFEGLARTPPMGWSSWNHFGCGIDEQLIRETADAMVELGLRDAGYVYLNLDDCWQGVRDSLGFIQADPKQFPSGMKALADYVHEQGLKLGIYSDAGSQTCCSCRPGSLGHEYQDALTYAKWGVDLLKYDWCHTEDINPKGAYKLMRDALYATGRPVLFSLCEWGKSQPWRWAKEVGHMWRTTTDIHPCFDCIEDYGLFQTYGVLQILDGQDSLRQYAGPGHWNDPDMLQVGNGMTVNQDRAHFTMWCMLAAPLILGNDLTRMTQATRDIVLNREVIAVDQDTLGIQGFRYRSDNGLEFWFKPLSGGDWAFCLLNRTEKDREYRIDWQTFDLFDELSNRATAFDRQVYTIRNLWSRRKEGTTKKARTVTVPAEDVLLYRLSPKR